MSHSGLVAVAPQPAGIPGALPPVVAARSRGARWTAMALTMGSLLLVYGCWQVFHWTPGHRKLVGDMFFYPVGVA
jgi:hypothetical protein